MPIYEYRCPACASSFEQYVKTFNATVRCPACDSSEVQKQLSTFAMAGGSQAVPRAGARGGACCGGGCGCRH